MAISGITTTLWFTSEAQEAVNFYTSLFPDSEIRETSYYGAGAPMPEGSVLTVSFTIFGQSFLALNGGEHDPHNDAVSFQISCDTQDEIDHLWNSIIADGGEESMCGWCHDRFGVRWQITPAELPGLLGSSDPAEAQFAWQAMMEMKKFVIKDLRP